MATLLAPIPITAEDLTQLYERIQKKQQPIITQQQLESRLWESAEILRGSIDSSDYKQYIFGLLFLKRMSDVFMEEAAKAFAEEGDLQTALNDPDYHQFFVPLHVRWTELQRYTSNVGEILNVACSALEEANQGKLQGILETVDFNAKDRLSDATLTQLIQNFSELPLGNSNLEKPDILGEAYEYLVEKFADDAGKKGGEFRTPHTVVRVLVELLEPKPGMRICDPTAGSTGMLIECAKYVERNGGDPRDLTLHGQEKNLNTWAIGKMNLLIHGIVDHRIERGDTIRDPKLRDGNELFLYDRVIANPPFSLKNWGLQEAQNDGFGRFKYGLPSNSYGDLAFVQHMLATLNLHGKMAVVMPHGVLFRGGAEQAIRKGILEDDLFEAVIGLPPNLFFGTVIPASILVLNRAKPVERQGKILFIHAAEDYLEGKNKNFLRDEDIENIVEAFKKYEDIEKYCRIVTLDEIRNNNYNLSVSRYVDVGEEEEEIDTVQAVAELRELEFERLRIEEKMYGILKELGLDE